MLILNDNKWSECSVHTSREPISMSTELRPRAVRSLSSVQTLFFGWFECHFLFMSILMYPSLTYWDISVHVGPALLGTQAAVSPAEPLTIQRYDKSFEDPCVRRCERGLLEDRALLDHHGDTPLQNFIPVKAMRPLNTPLFLAITTLTVQLQYPTRNTGKIIKIIYASIRTWQNATPTLTQNTVETIHTVSCKHTCKSLSCRHKDHFQLLWNDRLNTAWAEYMPFLSRRQVHIHPPRKDANNVSRNSLCGIQLEVARQKRIYSNAPVYMPLLSWNLT